MSGPVPPSEPVQVVGNTQGQTLAFGYTNFEDEHFAYPKCMYRGYALILNNEKFTSSRVLGKRRLGSHYDAEGLREALIHVGFQSHHIRIETDKTRGDMCQILQEVSKKNFTDFGCLIVAVFSFGDENFRVFGTDAELTYQQIISPFRHEAAPTLFDKPKLFIVQSEPLTRLTHDALPPVLTSKIISEPDVLFVVSHDDEDIAWKDAQKGTWFIQSLIEVLKLDGKRLDMMSVMTRVNYLTRRYYESYVRENAAQARCPSIHSLLTKTFNIVGGHID